MHLATLALRLQNRASMRRALLVAAVAIPVIVLAVVSAGGGQLLEVDHFNPSGPTSYVNASHCGGANLNLEWNIQTATGVPFTGGGNYNLFASSVQPSQATGSNGVYCAEQPSTSPAVEAGPIGSVTADQTVKQFAASAQTAATEAGKGCDATNEGQSFWICAHWVDSNGTRNGFASGKFTVQVKVPAVPTIQGIEEGDQALRVTWSQPTGDAAADRYRITAATTDPRDTAPQPHVASDVRATELRMTGLVNGATYTVNVTAISIAGNESGASADAFGTPVHVLNFWDAYRNAGGREEGGCGAGGAGPFALLGLAGVLAVTRRRK